MAIIKLIKNVRDELVTNGSNNKIAVIAPSMGGQISRYALSYMEKSLQETGNEDWKHNVYLWVSVDSPHLGANIPLGDQALLYLVRNSSGAADDFYNNQLSSPAAQQQLIEFHRPQVVPNPLYPQFSQQPFFINYNVAEPTMLNAQTTSQGMIANRGNSMFQEHYNRQNSNGIVGSNGWPQNLRKIAVVNGSLTGSKETQAINGDPLPTYAEDGERVLNIRGFWKVHLSSLGFSVTWRVHVASLESIFLPSTGKNERIARFKRVPEDRTTGATNTNIRGVMDNVPGGFLDAQHQIKETTIHTFPSLLNEWQVRDFNPLHSFIPTFSAIAHLEPNQRWDNALGYNLACTTNKKTPFDSYFGGDKNTQHTSFTKESVEWLLKELAGVPQLPNYPLEDNLLFGSHSICLNTDTVYSFNNPCKLPSVVTQWSVSPNLEIISQSDYSITVMAIENGEATIRAYFQNGKSTVKTIYAGGPVLSQFTFGNLGSAQSFCLAPDTSNFAYSIPELNDSDEVIATFSGLSQAESIVNTNWQWKKLNNAIAINGLKNRRNICTMSVGQTSVSVRAKNACGWGDWYELPFEITALPPSIEGRMYSVFPNPSDNVVNIDLANQSSAPLVTDVISGELFDLMGFSKGNITIINNKATFSVSGLSTGIYIVKIYINGISESHQIAVP
jgi:hypothetical protein